MPVLLVGNGPGYCWWSWWYGIQVPTTFRDPAASVGATWSWWSTVIWVAGGGGGGGKHLQIRAGGGPGGPYAGGGDGGNGNSNGDNALQKILDLVVVLQPFSPYLVLQEVVLVLFSSLTQPDKYLKT